ncbi:predicted protein [Thalassiosira pseudonana CCMP1335]|uniref:Uncharacterized protein n=1 Tax=Thalassiosira pseudonana TaxID=35128 RepID=B8BV70_THAPS|nr:predicted protein [Thalassiosira pseudonana CCMP1335]EED95408.1 predicted protein [Thalassiosira pseudonana CCMP1335]
MVVLEAAAITAGSIAAYKGGKAAVTESAKKIKTKMKLSNQEKDRKETFNSRKTERSERFAQINQYRESMKDMHKESGVLPSFNWAKKEKTATTTSSSGRMGGSSRASLSSYSKSGSTINQSSSSSKAWYES